MPNVEVQNTSAQLEASTLITEEDAATIEGLHTFDRDPSAPFAVSANSAVVTNLDADKLDGSHASAFATLAGGQTIAGNNTFSGQVTLAATVPLYLDGGGDTYIQEAAANDVRHVVGGATRLQITPTSLSIVNAVVSTPVSHAGGNNCDVGAAFVVSFTGAPTGIAGGVSGRILFCLNNSGSDIILAGDHRWVIYLVRWTSGDFRLQWHDLSLDRYWHLNGSPSPDTTV
jgi:hypothetical protein